jgi:hypothetical protein
MRWNHPGAALVGFVLTGCVTIVSNYRPGTVVSATVGYPLIDVQQRNETFSGTLSARQLIYGGKSGDTVKLTYREYRGGHGHIQQDLEFDLSKSRKIAFQEMRLEVIEANNEKISANVLPAAEEESRGLILETPAASGAAGRGEGARPFPTDY